MNVYIKQMLRAVSDYIVSDRNKSFRILNVSSLNRIVCMFIESSYEGEMRTPSKYC